jgi:hypothetical protein
VFACPPAQAADSNTVTAQDGANRQAQAKPATPAPMMATDGVACIGGQWAEKTTHGAGGRDSSMTMQHLSRRGDRPNSYTS